MRDQARFGLQSNLVGNQSEELSFANLMASPTGHKTVSSGGTNDLGFAIESVLQGGGLAGSKKAQKN